MNKTSWRLEDLKKIPKNGCRVFSTFACGGGSTMGYKLSGFNVIGANDIDPEMANVYKTNHKPNQYYLMPINQFIKDIQKNGVPENLKNLDILDGSPPCSSFSTAGNREKDWGKNKKFREGQASQILNDLFFDYIELVNILKPKTFIAENVTGIIKGKAKGYAKEIVNQLKELGYLVQVLKINATSCGVAQSRERIFFIGSLQKTKRLNFSPKCKVKNFIDVCSDLELENIDKKAAMLNSKTKEFFLWQRTKPGYSLSTVHPTKMFFSHHRLRKDKPSPTIVASGGILHYQEPRRLTWLETLRLGSFPDDYNLCEPNRKKWNQKATYLVGMSVPPFMIRDLSAAIYNQWLNDF